MDAFLKWEVLALLKHLLGSAKAFYKPHIFLSRASLIAHSNCKAITQYSQQQSLSAYIRNI